MHKIIFKFIIFILLTMVVTSCAGFSLPLTDPEFMKGAEFAQAFAKEDAKASGCNLYRRSMFILAGHAGLKAREYEQRLRDEGRSDNFIQGFYFGYEEEYVDLIDIYCGQ